MSWSLAARGGSVTLVQDNKHAGLNTVEVARLSGGGDLEFLAEKSDLASHFLRIMDTEAGYAGQLSVQVGSEAGQGSVMGHALAELHGGSLGKVTLSSSGTGFGVAGNACIRGLVGGEGSYLYSGELDSSSVLSGGSKAAHIKAQSHVLTIDTDSSNTFYGSVLRGTAAGSESSSSLSIVKRGDGTQEFRGPSNAGLQGGNFTVEGGSLQISGDLAATDVTLSVDASLICSGTVTVKGVLSVVSPLASGSMASLSTLGAPSTSGTLSADLNLSQAQALNLSGALDLDRHALTLNPDQTLSLTLSGDWIPRDAGDFDLMIFSGLDTLTLGSSVYKSDVEVAASLYLDGAMINDETRLVYSNGTLSLTGLMAIPEPATATLSLLALAGLLLRRRR